MHTHTHGILCGRIDNKWLEVILCEELEMTEGQKIFPFLVIILFEFLQTKCVVHLKSLKKIPIWENKSQVVWKSALFQPAPIWVLGWRQRFAKVYRNCHMLPQGLRYPLATQAGGSHWWEQQLGADWVLSLFRGSGPPCPAHLSHQWHCGIFLLYLHSKKSM